MYEMTKLFDMEKKTELSKEDERILNNVGYSKESSADCYNSESVRYDFIQRYGDLIRKRNKEFLNTKTGCKTFFTFHRLKKENQTCLELRHEMEGNIIYFFFDENDNFLTFSMNFDHFYWHPDEMTKEAYALIHEFKGIENENEER